MKHHELLSLKKRTMTTAAAADDNDGDGWFLWHVFMGTKAFTREVMRAGNDTRECTKLDVQHESIWKNKHYFN